MFAILDKAKPDIESIRGLNLAAVKHTTVVAKASRNMAKSAVLSLFQGNSSVARRKIRRLSV
jgi:hypothetical protein